MSSFRCATNKDREERLKNSMFAEKVKNTVEKDLTIRHFYDSISQLIQERRHMCALYVVLRSPDRAVSTGIREKIVLEQMLNKV